MSPSKKQTTSKASQPVPCNKTESLTGELAEMHQRIVDRAHDFFNGHGRLFERALDDWLAAERELKWQPPVRLSEEDAHYTVDVEAAGIDPADIDIQVTSGQILVKSNAADKKARRDKSGADRFRTLFRTVNLPRPIDPDKVKAESRFGLLRITAPLAEKASVKHIPVAA